MQGGFGMVGLISKNNYSHVGSCFLLVRRVVVFGNWVIYILYI